MIKILLPYSQGIWGLIQGLRDNYGDGRFLKTLEDVVLGLVLKHDIQYDYVVGNPPYVRIQNLPERQREYWQGLYTWASGNFDIYIPFLERPLAADPPWLVEGGKLGYVISNSFLISEAARPMRGLFSQSALVRSFTDFKAARFLDGNLFSDAMTYTCVIAAERSPSPVYGRFPVIRFAPRRVPLSRSDAIERTADAHRLFRRADMDTDIHSEITVGEEIIADGFWQPNTTLRERGWYFMPDDELEVFDHIERLGGERDPELEPFFGNPGFRRLINYTSTESGGFAGVQTSLDDLMILRVLERNQAQGLILAEPKQGGDAVWIEEDVTRRFLFGSNVWRWAIHDEEWIVLFPYFEHQGRYLFIPSERYLQHERRGRRGRRNENVRVFSGWPDTAPRIETDYPNFHAYLLEHENDFRRRENSRFAVGRADEWRWYDLAYPRSLVEANRAKIVAQLLARSRQFAVDREGEYLFQAGGKGGGVYGISPLRANDLLILLGLLNSDVGDFYLRHITQFYNSSGSASYADAFLKFLPIPALNENERRALAQSADALSIAAARSRELGSLISSAPQSIFAHFRALGRTIDANVLSRQARSANLARRLSGGSATMSQLSNGEAELRIGRGSMRLMPALGQLVLVALQARGTLLRDELLATYFPTARADWELFAATLQEWQGVLLTLRETIARDEEQHEALVRTMYHIDLQGCETINRFLDRF